MKQILSKNPVMDWIDHLSGSQRVGMLIGIFALGLFFQISAFFRGNNIDNRWGIVLIPAAWVIINGVIYLMLGFQIHWERVTRNRVANVCTLVTLFLFVIVISGSLIMFSNPSGDPKLMMTSTSSDGTCTIQVYETEFNIFEGFDADVYVKWADRSEDKEHIMEIKNSYQMRISWVDNDQVTINGQVFVVQDGKIWRAN